MSARKARWKPSPYELRPKRLLPGSDVWADCEFTDLKRGDIFRTYLPNGHQVHPITQEPCHPRITGVCRADVIRNTRTGVGYMFECLVGPYPEVVQYMAH